LAATESVTDVHASIKTTENVYVQTIKESVLAAANSRGGAIWYPRAALVSNLNQHTLQK